MQVFKDVPTLTARPTLTEQNGVPHKLFGFLPPDADFSVAAWVNAAADEMNAAWESGKIPVLTGGTGLYFKALTEGLHFMPDVDEKIRLDVRERMKTVGREAFLKEYLEKDPSFPFTDPQRLTRAAEILQSTGHPLSYWRARPKTKSVDAVFYTVVMLPDRPILYKRCDDRFDRMMTGPVFDEIDALTAQNPPENSLILKAVGVKELTAFKKGDISLERAVELAKQHTRNYAKRQTTWFTRQTRAEKIVSDDNFDAVLTDVLRFAC